MEKEIKDSDLLLGYDPMWEEYVIVEHHYDSPNHGDNFCFRIGADSISDGDGAPASYDDTYVIIDKKDYHHVMELFHKAGEEMWSLVENHGEYLMRPIVTGDYIFEGCAFLHIKEISENREEVLAEQFYYDIYDLNVDTDPEILEKDDGYDIEQLESDCLLISEEIYNEALNIGKSSIVEITHYLRQILIQNQ